jgi:hypothetical protein
MSLFAHARRLRARQSFLSVEELENRLLPSVAQWASSVLGFSSQYTSGPWSASQAIGQPDTPFYGDTSSAWAPVPENGTHEFISLGFATPVYASNVTVRETDGNGFVFQLDVIDTNGVAHTVWTGADPSQPDAPANFNIQFTPTNYLVQGVTVYVDTDHNLNSWEEIDAVQLAGVDTPPDQPPVAVDDSATTNEGQSVAINVLANDSDPDVGDSLRVQSITPPAHGSINVNSDGTLQYTPAFGYSGSDGFSYTVADNSGATASANVAVMVNPLLPLVVGNQTLTGPAGAPITGNVLTGASDPNGFTLSAQVATAPQHGSVTVNSDGSFVYTPTPGYVGADSFTYQASDGRGPTATGTINITLLASQPPIAKSDFFVGAPRTPIQGNVLSNDKDPGGFTLTAQLVKGPKHGTLTLNTDGSFTYTPKAGYRGLDTFTYQASNGHGGTDQALVVLLVREEHSKGGGHGDDHDHHRHHGHAHGGGSFKVPYTLAARPL